MKEEHVDWFDQYRKGTLSKEEMERMKMKLNSDHELNKAYQEFLDLTTAVETKGLLKEMNIWHEKLEVSASKESRATLWKILIVVGAILVVLMLLWHQSKKTTLNNVNEELYAQFYYPDPGLPTTMAAKGNNDFLVGMVYYKSENYTDALGLWNSITFSKDSLDYYKAQALMELGQDAESIELLSSIDTDHPFYIKSKWYLLLLALKNNDIPKVTELMEELKSANYRLEKLAIIENEMPQK